MEVLGGHRRERCGKPGERLLDRRVERRAPEREPAASALRQLRMHEPLADGAAGEVAYGQEHAGAVTELLLGRPGDELGRRDGAGGHLHVEHVEAAGVADRQVRGEGAVVAAQERVRVPVRVPDQLEGLAHDPTS